MKNIYKSILVLMTAAAVVSCNVENLGTTFDPAATDDGVSFVQALVNSTSIPASTANYSITVGRTNSAAAQTVSVSSTLPDGICPSSVSFAAGQSEAELVLDISELEVGKTCTGNIQLADQPGYARSSIKVTLAKAYTWVSLGEGQFYDGLALQPSDTDYGIVKCEVLQAEGFQRWRLMNPFPKDQLVKAWGADYVTYTPDSYIEFFVNSDGVIQFTSNVIKTGLTYVDLAADAYIVYYYPSAYSSALASYDAENKFVMDKVAQFCFAQVIANTTSWFGPGNKYLSLPGGPDLEDIL
ncbi:MAG: hypothetical protein K5910_09300 [Bacteroidales bacterium]|nr:hypothetical protein [Bacteroidales bacterium]